AVADCGARVVLVLDTELDEVELPAVERLRIPRDGPGVEGDADPTVHASLDDLFYVMPTSGSTGGPKGVAVPQRGVLRLVCSPDYVQVTRDDVFLQFAPWPFDASTFEVWAPLLHGAKLVVHPHYLPSVEELGRTIQESGATVLWLTASLFRQMVDAAPESLGGVRQLLAGGDVLSPQHVRTIKSLVPGCRVINGYGPTENTTFTCTFEVPADAAFTSVPIGKPINDTSVYVLDRARNLVPVGVAGELYIGGDGLARGYLNRPELTAARFVESPFEAGRRLYRTGDSVRWLADGNLEFLGRLDDQVKIRGFRVEPGEVQAVLATHPEVEDCVVVAREAAPGEKRLVAYVVSRNGGQPVDEWSDAEEPAGWVHGLRAHLRAVLPDWMVPSYFVPMDALPLNANGKVDRGALPPPGQARPDLAEPVAPPCGEVEEALAAIWSSLLGVELVGVDDNFFDLGGHSLLGTQMISRIRDAFHVELPLRRLFESPTIAGLAAALAEMTADATDQAAPQPVAIGPSQAPVNIDELSDDEVDRLLRDMLGNGAPG
ncbi:MAG TPA: non-ribosomal peptide synthetase, partial [Thermoanaerobaculia bacterium]|nr:non-ribosomal peptide synthetase [Thermoanaerobaculia bacterium]